MTQDHPTVTTPLPTYQQLPELPSGARSAWNVFGENDQIGLLNLQTPNRIRAAAGLVSTGEMFPLNAELSLIDPPLFGRAAAEHTVVDLGVGWDFDDKLDNYYPQASSQWDSLAHIGYAPDQFYNGATAAQVNDRSRNSIANWATKGIAGRGVLLDIDALFGHAGVGFDPGRSRSISVADLEDARAAAAIAWQPGDIALLNTGYLRWYSTLDERSRLDIACLDIPSSVGLAPGPEMLEYLWDSRISAAVSDNPAVERLPFDLSQEAWPHGFLHHCLIGQLGMALGELWWLSDLAEACRTNQRYEVFLSAAPANIRGGIGSPANAIAFM